MTLRNTSTITSYNRSTEDSWGNRPLIVAPSIIMMLYETHSSTIQRLSYTKLSKKSTLMHPMIVLQIRLIHPDIIRKPTQSVFTIGRRCLTLGAPEFVVSDEARRPSALVRAIPFEVFAKKSGNWPGASSESSSRVRERPWESVRGRKRRYTKMDQEAAWDRKSVV